MLKIIPAVLTTARLVTCDTDLAEASLETGQLPASVEVSERPWVWLRVNASEQLRHRAEVVEGAPKRAAKLFGALANAEYARSVAIVSWAGLKELLKTASFHVGED